MLLMVILSCLLLLALSAFFSSSETALMSLNRYRLRHLERKQRRAAIVREVLSHPEKVLGTILTGNTFVNTAAGALVTYAVTVMVANPEREEQAVLIGTLAVTATLLIFGEMVPKSYAARHPEKMSFLVIRPILLLIKLLGPVVKLLTFISNGFLRLLGETPGPLRHEITLEEIKAIVYAGGEASELEAGKRQMLRKVFELGERRVSEVMVPRTEIVAVELGASLEEVVELIQKRRFSRMPVFRETLDRIEGLVYSKDILAYWGKPIPFGLSQVLRKAYFVPDSAKVEQALEQLQKHRVHIAMVVDEHGGVEGLVTLEDLIEEIVGEIRDELEEEADQVRQLAEGTFLIDASVPVKDLNVRLDLSLPEQPDYNTLAGFILTRLGRIPIEGEELVAGGMVLSVDKVDHRRIVRVKARPARSASRPKPVALPRREPEGPRELPEAAQSSSSPKKK